MVSLLRFRVLNVPVVSTGESRSLSEHVVLRENSNQDPLSPFLNWSAIQILFEETKSDTLFLLDCSAGRSAPGVVRGVNETISACGPETFTTGLDRHLFTNALISVLDKWTSRVSFSAAMLHSEILAESKPDWPEKKDCTDKRTAEKRGMPAYIIASGGPHFPSIEIARRRGYDNPSRTSANFSRPTPSPTPSLTPIFSKLDVYNPANLNKTLESGELQIPHVLISVALKEDQTSGLESWYACVKEIPALAAYAVVEAIYKSYSTMLLVSIPLLLWNMLPDDPAVLFVAYVLSNNLLAANSAEIIQRLADTKQGAPRRKSKLSGKTVQFAPPHIEINTPSKVGPPPLSAVKSHPMPVADLPQVADIKQHSISKVDPPQLVDIKPHYLSTVDHLGLPLDLKLPQNPPQHHHPRSVVKVIPSAEIKTSHPRMPASSSLPESKPQSQTMTKPDTALPKYDISTPTSKELAMEKHIKELIQSAQLAREEASRAWDELGRREKKDRARHSALKAGKPVYINSIQVSPTEQRHHKSKAEAVLGTLITPLNSAPALLRGSGEENRPTTAPPPASQRGRVSFEERRPLMFDVGVRREIGEEKNPTTRRELRFVDHKAKKLYTPFPPQRPLPNNPPPKKTLTPLPLSPPLLRPAPDPEVLKHMVSFQSRISSAGPSPPVTPEKRREDRWTFLDDEDEVVAAVAVGEVKRKGSKLVKKKRGEQRSGRE